MQLNWQQKKNIDIIIPILLTGVAGVMVIRKTRDWKIIIGVILGAFVLGYIVVSQVTKNLYNGVPHDMPLPADVENPNSLCANYTPTALVNGLHDDITCVFCTRNKDVYYQLLALDNCSFVKCYNDWKNRYSAKVGQSLPQAIADESSFWDSDFGVLQNALQQKFSSLNLS